MENIFDLTGKTALVTGAARGLGRAAAEGLAQHGADVGLIDLAAESQAAACAQIEKLGRKARAYACDVADEEVVKTVCRDVLSEFGKIDVLVNIAGITARIPSTDMPPDTVRRLMDVNYLGTFWMCREIGGHMLSHRSGSIINMSALGGGILGLGRGNAAYCSTKGAVASLTRDLACEWGPFGIRVNAVAPSWFQTDMNADSIFANVSFMEQVRTKLPMGRIGRPEELVGPVVFLASNAASMITGLVLPVDGGAAATCPIEWVEQGSELGREE